MTTTMMAFLMLDLTETGPSPTTMTNAGLANWDGRPVLQMITIKTVAETQPKMTMMTTTGCLTQMTIAPRAILAGPQTPQPTMTVMGAKMPLKTQTMIMMA